MVRVPSSEAPRPRPGRSRQVALATGIALLMSGSLVAAPAIADDSELRPTDGTLTTTLVEDAPSPEASPDETTPAPEADETAPSEPTDATAPTGAPVPAPAESSSPAPAEPTDDVSPVEEPTDAPAPAETAQGTIADLPAADPAATDEESAGPLADALAVATTTSTGAASTSTAPAMSLRTATPFAVGGALRGSVVHVETYDPAAGTVVSLLRFLDGEWKTETTATADATGSYAFTGLPTAKYILRYAPTAVSGLKSTYCGLDDCVDDIDEITSSLARIPVANGSSFVMDTGLTVASELTGTVSNQKSVRIRGVVVTAYRLVGSQWKPAGRATTDGNGEFTIGDIGAGSFRFRFQPAGDSGYSQYYWAGNGTNKATTLASAKTETLEYGSVYTFTSYVNEGGPAVYAGDVSFGGGAQVGRTLTGDPGTWSPTGVSLAYTWLRNGAAISGATSRTYVLTGDDNGKSISLRVTGSRSGFPTASATSAAKKIAPGTLTAGTVSISGSVKVGSALTAKTSGWGPAGVALGYAWLRNGAPIEGATRSTYVPTAVDLAQKISVKVTATKHGFTTITATTPEKSVALGTLTQPSLSLTGSAQVGSKLTLASGTWGPGTVKVSYQWLRDGAAIKGAVGTSYVATPDDLSKAISLTVTARKNGYRTIITTTVAKTVALGVLTPQGGLSVTGSAAVGKTLTGKTGAWGPGTVNVRYAWFRDGRAIAGATSGTYKLAPADLGTNVTLQVRATKNGYRTVVLTSVAKKVALGTLTSTAKPSIIGTAAVNRTLKVNTGTWGPGTVKLTYRWFRNGKAITGATAQTYAVTATDRGALLTVQVRAAKNGFRTQVLTTAAVRPS